MKSDKDIRANNRAGLLGAAPAASILPALSYQSGVAVTGAPAKPTMTLDAAYERYKAGKLGFGRSDMFGVIIAEIKELQRRIGGVDEAAVNAIGERVSSLERVIGNALTRPDPVAPAVVKRGPGRPARAAQPMEAANG